jgi:pSer/pThr/pTyr-binding forkhead associated (FHA) protein
MLFDHSSYGTWLNDERVAHRTRLKAGDRLRLGYPGIVLELIAIDAR